MAIEDRQISTGVRTTLTGTALEVFIFYQEADLIALQFFVAIQNIAVEGVSFIGGELGYTFENINDLFEINNIGDLIVNSAFPERYEIAANGDLIYTTPD